jgi:hypothetical protein
VKARKRKRAVQARICHNKRWGWGVDKVVNAVATACSRFSVKMAEVYAKARQERMEA